MRRPRRWKPKSQWMVTVRCIRSEYRLRPDKERMQLVGFWLAKAQARHLGVRIFGVIQMSNHLHLIVEDQNSELSRFMEFFLGNLAKDINRLDRTRGQVFERRFSPTEILDNEALHEMLAYVVANPTKARLVRTPERWPGLCMYPRREVEEPVTYTRFKRWAYEDAKRKAKKGQVISKDAFVEEATLDACERAKIDSEELEARIEARTKAIIKEARAKGVGFLGVKRVLAQSSMGRPRRTKRSPCPLCHASSLRGWKDYLSIWRSFVKQYRKASRLFLEGDLTVLFPKYSFRPSSRECFVG